MRYMDIEGHIYHCSTRRGRAHVARVRAGIVAPAEVRNMCASWHVKIIDFDAIRVHRGK